MHAHDNLSHWAATVAIALSVALSACGSTACGSTVSDSTMSDSTVSDSTTETTVLPETSTVPGSDDSSGATITAAAEDSPNIEPVPDDWAETEITFESTLGTIYATITHPVADETRTPAALLIGGSGPTDRDGNSPLVPGEIGTLKAVARWLANDGITTLRYDKPGSGKTGVNDLPSESVTAGDYLALNAEALSALAAQDSVDPDQLTVVGHSEGALFALLLATGDVDSVAGAHDVQSIALLQPLSVPMLDVLESQVSAQISDAVEAGQMTDEIGETYRSSLTEAIAATRRGDLVPDDMPAALAPLFNQSSAEYLRTIDKLDPRVIAADLPPEFPVLLSCSNADVQVACSDVQQLAEAARNAGANVNFVQLDGVSHALKVGDSPSPLDLTADLPFSPDLRAALADWADQS